MNLFLTNEHRKCMGLNPVLENWELISIENNVYIYIEGNIIRKVIRGSDSYPNLSFHETDVYYEVSEDRSQVLPKTNRGKPRKLNFTTVNHLDGYGNYLFISYRESSNSTTVLIGNYTNQRTYYEEEGIENLDTFDKIKLWCDEFVKNTSQEELEELEQFIHTPRQHIKFRTGDYFRVKIGKKYTYGRVLMDVIRDSKKEGFTYEMFIGRPVIVEMFHILTNDKNVSINTLKKLKTFPSEHIFHNNLYYGDYKIIGYEELPEFVRYPIMYGRSPRNGKIFFQWGKIYIEENFNEQNYFGSYRNSFIGFEVCKNSKIIQKCIDENNNQAYWDYYKIYEEDLRNPINADVLIKVLNHYNLAFLLKEYNNDR